MSASTPSHARCARTAASSRACDRPELPHGKPATVLSVRSGVVTLALVLALLGTPVPASASSAEPTTGAKVADAVLVRPLAVVGAAVSTVAFFVAVVPAWVVGVDDRDLAHHMVKRPWHYVHGRELGHFDDTF